MNTISTVSTWTDIINQFFLIFTVPGAKILIRLIEGWILCTVRRTVTGILPFADPAGQKAHDAYHRFFPDASWALSELWKLLTILLVRIFYPTGVIPADLDDTLFHHSGRKVNGAGWWRDAVRSTKSKTICAWGLNLVVLTLQIQPPWGGEPLGLPVNMRLHRKKQASLIELAEQMVNEVIQWFPAGCFVWLETVFMQLWREKNWLQRLFPESNATQKFTICRSSSPAGKDVAVPARKANNFHLRKNW